MDQKQTARHATPSAAKKMPAGHRHVISMLVEDEFGVLQRVAGVFSRRGFNIASITVGTSEQEGVSRMTITTSGDDRTVEQMIKQLNKLVEVIKVSELGAECIERETTLVKVHVKDPAARSEIINYAAIFGAKIADTKQKSMVVELVGKPHKVDEFLQLVRPFGVKELVRTGVTALARDPA